MNANEGATFIRLKRTAYRLELGRMTYQPPLARPKRAGEEFARTHFQEDDPDGVPSSKKPRFDVRNPSALAPDAKEEDAILDADEIGKRGQQTKRNAVNIDGYDSDSSNEGFDGRADAKVKENKKKKGGADGGESKDEEENDMFADLDEDAEAGGGGDGDDDEELTREGKKKRKNVRFLAAEDIEGQVTSSTGGGHVSADFSLNGKAPARASKGGHLNGSGLAGDASDANSSDSDVGDEDRAAIGSADEEVGAGGKKEHAPRLDAFNMKGEQEEGRFDDQGNFVRKAVDPDAVHDSWLEGVSKRDMKRAREAAERRDERERQRQREEDLVQTSDILKSLILRLERGETPLEALARLGRGKQKQKPKPKWHQQAHKSRSKKEDNGRDGEEEAAMEIDKPNANPSSNHDMGPGPDPDSAENHRRKTIDAITTAADQLLTRGQMEIYDTERESLQRYYSRETGEAWIEPSTSTTTTSSTEEAAAAVRGTTSGNGGHGGKGGNGGKKKWEYRWSDARDGGAAHGPYEGDMMAAWTQAGYFGEAVEFREVLPGGRDGGGGGWTRVVEFV